ncbi:diguanylate cyclase [Dyella sp. A6]|uniref:GGDEF domain-containing protein n=1 Tax=Dyella aluminiiresistens TaxID=3069105 RepID=UPI002E7693E7|nr:diguanylate cyclase [Dyella sp. A6]
MPVATPPPATGAATSPPSTQPAKAPALPDMPNRSPLASGAPSAIPNTTPNRHGSLHWTIAAFLLTLGGAWLLWRRNERLARESQRMARQQRALQSANTRLQDESRQLRQLATNDPLTGVLNRQAFATGLRERIAHLSHYDRPLSLIVLDLDHFKSINDRLGHLAGDSALKLVAGVVHEHLVSDDLFGRFGGDEFLIACAERTPESAVELADTIRAAVALAAPTHAPPLPGLTLSMGVATADATTGYSADALFARADAALYDAKSRGRNRVVQADDATPTFAGTAPGSRHL